MKQLFGQLSSIWLNAKVFHKIVLIVTFLLFCSVLCFVLLPSYESYSRIASISEKEVKRFLESSGIPFKIKQRSLLVPTAQVEHLREEINLLKEEKGFELFDSNTWIKGEKELQVLEMRALKGQLERDLASFENIKAARVILDLAPSRKFGGQQYKTKASVILTLMPGARLDDSQLSAITFHLAGAVRGLQANMVAISDTTGRLYQAIDGEEHKVTREERTRDQVVSLLSRMVGAERYLLEGDEIFIDKTIENLDEIEQALAVVADVHLHPITFQNKSEATERGFGLLNLLLFLAIVLVVLIFTVPIIQKKKEKRLFEMATKVDMGVLASSLKEEDPEVVAWMLSYMEPRRAEEMVAAFPQDYQEALMHHLADMEKNER